MWLLAPSWLTIYENIPSSSFWAFLLPSVKPVFVFKVTAVTLSSHSVALVCTCRISKAT